MARVSSLTIIGASCAALFVSPPAQADVHAQEEGPDAGLAERLDDYFGPLAATSDFSGIIRVERDGEPLAVRRYGYADWPSRREHDDQTLYAGASITKGILAVLLLQLVDEERVALDAPVHWYLPALGERPGMTVEAVLRHQAGLPRDLPDGIDLEAFDGGVAGWLAANETLLRPVGEEAYSNVGYALLADLIEAATGTPFADLARQRVLIPAGMTDSVVSPEQVADLPKGASAYMPGPAPSGVETPMPAGLEPGASGLVTTARDLSMWGRALADLQDTELFAGDDPLGSLDRDVEEGALSISAQGSLPGYAAGVTIWPETGVTVAYTCNLFDFPVIGIEGVLRRIVRGEAPVPPDARPADVALGAEHRALAGLYDHPSFGRIAIAEDESGLGMRLTMPDRETYWRFYLTPVEGGRLHWRAFDTIFEASSEGTLSAIGSVSRDPEPVRVERVAEP